MFTKSKWTILKGQSGMVMPMVMMIMVLALCIVAPGLAAAGSMANVNRELESSTMAYYAAEAGIEDVCWRFKKSMEPANLIVNNMNVTLSQSKAPETHVDTDYPTYNTIRTTTTTTYYMQSTARLRGSDVTDPPKANLYTEIVKTVVDTEFIDDTGNEIGGSGGANGYPLQYAIATTGGEIKIDSNALVKSKPADNCSDVFANGKLDVNGSVHGKGYYTTIGEGCSNTWGGCEKIPTVSFQTLNKTWYLQQAQLGDHWPTSPEPENWGNLSLSQLPHGTGTYDINGTVYLGGPGNISYINGNLNIKAGGKLVLKGVVWVNGWITSNASSEIQTDPDKPDIQFYLLSHGTSTGDGHNINIESNTHVKANNNLNLICDYGTVTLHSNVGDEGSPALFGIVYAPNGHIKFDSNSWAVVSAVLGNSVVLDSNSMIIYDTNLRKNPIEGFELNVVPSGPETTVEISDYGG